MSIVFAKIVWEIFESDIISCENTPQGGIFRPVGLLFDVAVLVVTSFYFVLSSTKRQGCVGDFVCK